MADINSLMSRIDAEFVAVEDKIKKFQAEQVEEHKQREKRMEQLGKVFTELQDIWQPRLEMLIAKFGDRVRTTPRIVPSTREVTFEFESRIAQVRLKLAAFTDRDVKNLILRYDLEIIPILMRFKSHDEISFPLDAIDKKAVGEWIDDRLVDFVHTYFSMGENEIYMKDQMVEDPVAHISFPKFAAATNLDWQGQKYYFIGEETRREFEKKEGIAVK